MLNTAPRSLSAAHVVAFCNGIVASGQPRYIRLCPGRGSQLLECLPNVQRAVADAGGQLVLGWGVWEWTGVLLLADFHAIWRHPGGFEVDITPRRIPIPRIAFLEDRELVYHGRQINSIYKPLTQDPRVAEFVRLQMSQFSRMNAGERAAEQQVQLRGAEAAEHRAEEVRLGMLLGDLACSYPGFLPDDCNYTRPETLLIPMGDE